MTVRVSIVTVVFNGARDIERTLESVVSQDYESVERIVIDGGSSDGTPDIVRRYTELIDVFVSEPDGGIYDAMNKAVALATGDYLIFMNCGDVFASPQALTLAMDHASSDTEKVIFGAWIRMEGRNVQRLQKPSLTSGLFHHQAIIYSRSIHRWHGNYAVVPGLTTADYLFFATVLASGRTDVQVLDDPIAMIDVNGVSAGLQTFSQKHAIDYLCGRTSRWQLISVLALHPMYSTLKRLVRRVL